MACALSLSALAAALPSAAASSAASLADAHGDPDSRCSYVSRSSLLGVADSQSDDDEERVNHDGRAHIALSAEQQRAAEQRVREWGVEVLGSAAGQQTKCLPSTLARLLRLTLSRPPPLPAAYLQCAHRHRIALGLEPPEILEDLPGAPPRVPRKAKVLSELDRTQLAETLSAQLWALVAREVEPDFDEVTKSCSCMDAKDLAHIDKDLSGVDGVSLTYGEVTPNALAVVLASSWPKHLVPGTGVFVDIGSGSGKGVFAALLMHEWREVRGVEILKSLVAASVVIQRDWEREWKDQLIAKDNERRREEFELAQARASTSASAASASSAAAVSAAALSPSLPDPSISFLHADFRDVDWSDADVVLANSTCYDEDLMRDLTAYAERLRLGSLLVTFTKRVRSRHFRLISDDGAEMSWGWATVYVHRKVLPASFVDVVKTESSDCTELDKVISELPAQLTSEWKLRQMKEQAPQAENTQALTL